MKLWRDAAAMILPDLNDCPWEMAQNRLLLTARDFYTRSLAWRHSLEPFLTQAGVDEYDAVDFSGAEVVRVFDAWYGSQPLDPMTADQGQENAADAATSGVPTKISYSDQALYLSPTPAEGGVLVRADVALRPTLAATGLSDSLWALHIEAIVDGAKARLFSAQGKPYTDPNAGTEARFRFEAVIAREYWRTVKASSRGRGRTRAKMF